MAEQLPPEEFRNLLCRADPNFRRILIAMRLTGCRPGEIRTLIWEWVDFERALAGPQKAGYSTDLWTCRRVAELIAKKFRVKYHPDHVGKMLDELGRTSRSREPGRADLVACLPRPEV